MLKWAAIVAAAGFIFQMGAYSAREGSAGLVLAIPIGLLVVYPITTAWFWFLGTIGLFLWRALRRVRLVQR